MATIEQLKNFEVPEAFQNRANYYSSLGDKATQENDNGFHATNCYKKALHTLDDGSKKFPGHQFKAILSPAGLDFLLKKNVSKGNSTKDVLAEYKKQNTAVATV